MKSKNMATIYQGVFKDFLLGGGSFNHMNRKLGRYLSYLKFLPIPLYSGVVPRI